MKATTAVVFADYRSLPKIILTLTVIFGFCPAVVMGQSHQVSTPGTIPEIDTGEIRTLPGTDIDRIRIRDALKRAPSSSKATVTEETCLLPPLSLINSPTIPAEQLQTAAEARNDYHEACAALKRKKNADAEKLLRKAVQHYPKYSVAWVTLGQVLAAQQKNNEARSACSRSSIVDPTYVPAYLCLADIAAHAGAWDEVLALSGRALELDPANNAISYEYHAAANLEIHNLAAAEKSGLRAVEIDKDNREPRVHFVLAQIYEAKGDSENEAIQLRNYLKYATSPDDVAMVQQLLSKLEKHDRKGNTIDYRSGATQRGWFRHRRRAGGRPTLMKQFPRCEPTTPVHFNRS
jgi:tetratricopeptide (TPR) repeat protein